MTENFDPPKTDAVEPASSARVNFDPRKTDVFEAVSPNHLAETAPPAAAETVDESGAPVDAALTRRAVVADAPASPVKPPTNPGFFKRFFYDADGRLNRKSVALAAGFGALALVFLFSGGKENSQPDSKAKPFKSAASAVAESPRSSNIARTLTSGAAPESLLANGAPSPKPAPNAASGAPAAPFTAPAGATAPPASGSPAPKPAPKPANPAAAVADAPTANAAGQKSFVIPLRDARTEKRSLVAKTEKGESDAAPQSPTIPRGTRIALRLLEPLVTGAAAPVAAIVLEDVLDADGAVLIPKDTRAEIPFLGYDAAGRISNNRLQPALFLVSDVPGGLSAKGSVKGADGRAGVAGLVTQQRPGFMKRVLGAGARVGTAVVGSVGPGDAAGEAERAAGLDSVATVSPRGLRLVEVAKGTPFTFIVGL
jgi:hypothetical protein